MRPLVWFRADLRVEDNTALYHATRRATRGVVGVFIIARKQWKDHDWADIKVEFLRRNLLELDDRLNTLNIPLVILEEDWFKTAPESLMDLARKHECDALYFNREYEVNETRRDDAVQSKFEEGGLEVHAFTDQVVVPPGSLRTNEGKFYTVFTPFKKSWIARLEDDGRPVSHGKPKKQASKVTASDTIPDEIVGFKRRAHQYDDSIWPPGESAAKRRLSAFVREPIDDYSDQRDLPGDDGTSRLSAYLTLGVISPRQCLEAAIEANNGSINGRKTSASVWISELIWREFYRHVLVGFPRVSMHRAFNKSTESIDWRDSESDFEKWVNGETGYPIIDAGMRQLDSEGWVHNRVRMIVAMFLTKDLLIDWRKGERHFMQRLIDGDLASNNGGWQWSASTGTDAAPYFRIFNPLSQSKKYDSEGDYIRRHVPELREAPTELLHDLDRWSDDDRKRFDYPKPMVDHASGRDRAIEAFKAR
ncbi:MAG: deoxyribodipyrimidine photo-lyase [Phycisphaerales bacterium]